MIERSLPGLMLSLALVSSVWAQSPALPQAQPPTRAPYKACVAASGGVTAALNDCIGAEFKFQDVRLNKAYDALRQTLDQPHMTALRDEERAWIKSRDQQCEATAGSGTAAMLDSNACLLDLTAQRAADLERIRAQQ